MIFKPSWWLPTGHLQTCIAAFTQRPHTETTSEVIELKDGDQLELRWFQPENASETTPTLVLIHGLEGSVNSHYIQGMLKQAQMLKLRAVVLHLRGSNGRVNRLPESYHAGKTEDLITTLKIVKKRYPIATCIAIGYSLGANMLLKFLGEHPQQSWVDQAIAISPPFDLQASTSFVSKGINRIYERHFIKRLKGSIQKKLEHGILMPINLEALNKISSFYDFDDQITAPLHGFLSAKDYYTRCSSQYFLPEIATPTLIIHAEDDPIIPKEAIPTPQRFSKHVQLEVHKNGGHIGFISGGYPGNWRYWLDERIAQHLLRVIH